MTSATWSPVQDLRGQRGMEGGQAFPEQGRATTVSQRTTWGTGVPKGAPPVLTEGAVQVPSFSA